MDQGVLIGIIGILAGVGVSWYFYRKSHRISRLACDLPPPTIVDLRPKAITGTAREYLKATFQGKELGELSVVQATIKNTGTEPIRENDIEQPICFMFPSKVRVLASEIVDQSTDVQVFPAEPEGGSESALAWSFRSLDRGEYFTVQFLLEGAVEAPSVTARILGLPSGIEMSIAADERQPRFSGRKVVSVFLVILVMSAWAFKLRELETEVINSGRELQRLKDQNRELTAVMRDLVRDLQLAGIELESAPTDRIISRARGQEIFEQKCSLCHEIRSNDRKIGPGLRVIQDGSLPSGKAATPENILTRVNEGGGGMPAFEKLLAEREKKDVVTYVIEP